MTYKQILLYICTVLILFISGFTIIHSETKQSSPNFSRVEIKNYETLNVDTALADLKYEKYEKIKKIGLCNINKPKKYTFIKSEDWFSDLYYYMITEKHFPDIPYSYVVDQSNIYQSRVSFPIDLQPITDKETGIIIIGVVDLLNYNNKTLQDFVEQLAGFYQIEKTNIDVYDCEFDSKDIDNTFVSHLKIKTKNYDIDKLFQDFKIDTSTNRIYKTKIDNIKYEKETPPFEPLSISITLTNTGNVPWYKHNSIAVVTDMDFMKPSDYFISGTWMSRSHVKEIEELVLPGEQYTLEFLIQPSPLPVPQTESFILVDPNGSPIANTAFTVEFETENTDLSFVKVKPNQYGFLNVRKEPSTGSEIIKTVGISEIFTLVEITDHWLKIKIDDQTEGWVVRGYVEIIE